MESKKIKNDVKNEIKDILKNVNFVNSSSFLNNDSIDLLKENYDDLKDNMINFLNSLENLPNEITEDEICNYINVIIENAILNDLNVIKERIKTSTKKHLYLIDNKMEFLDNNYDLILGEIIKLILTM